MIKKIILFLLYIFKLKDLAISLWQFKMEKMYIKKEKATRQYYEAYSFKNNEDKVEVFDTLDKYKIILNPFCIVPENVHNKYKSRKIDVLFDDAQKLKYIVYDNKKMFFKRYMTDKEIVTYFNNISLEQELCSPHRYFSHHIKTYGVQYDMGGALKVSNVKMMIGLA